MLFLTLLSGPLALSSSAVQAGDPSCTDSCCQYPDVCAEACGDGCGDACGESCCSLFGDCGGGIAGLIKKSDHCFDDFISPMTNPVFFEDPRTLTEARLIYANHNLPNALGGNNVQIVAMQLRGAITDDLSIIATKDGYIISDNPLLDDGWADVAAGLKLNVYKNYETQTIASVGTTFELPVGSQRSLQGNGDGEFHMFASGGTEFLDD